jgi:hypothetical protein
MDLGNLCRSLGLDWSLLEYVSMSALLMLLAIHGHITKTINVFTPSDEAMSSPSIASISHVLLSISEPEPSVLSTRDYRDKGQ